MGARAGLQPWVGRHGPSVALVAIGLVLLVASLLQGPNRDVFALGLLVFGSALALIGVVLPRLQNAEVGPATGLKLSLAAARQSTSVLAEAVGGEEPGSTEEGRAEAADPHLPDVDEAVAATRWILASDTLGRLLAPAEGPLAGASFHLYLFDTEQALLLPAFEQGPNFGQPWKAGTGAVGEAWASGEYVLVRGQQVSDATYGLTPEQQQRYRTLAAVAAMPVVTAGDEVIAVLAGSSTDRCSPLATPDGFDAHLFVALQVARILVDLLKWFPD